MEYSIRQNLSVYTRAVSYMTDGSIWLTFLLVPIYILLASNPTFAPLNEVIMIIILSVAATFWLGYFYSKKIYGDKKGGIIWQYDLTPNYIIMAAGSIRATLKKDDVKFSRIYKNGIFFRHKKMNFCLLTSTDNSNEVLNFLEENSWLANKRRGYFSLLVYALLFPLSMFITLLYLSR